MAAALACTGGFVLAETTALPFYENFEPDFSWQLEWHAFDYPGNRYTDCPWPYTTEPRQDYCPDDPSNGKNIPAPTPNDSYTWGPYKFETWPDAANGGTVYSGERSGRQVTADPYWYAIYHIIDPPAPGKDLRLKSMVHDAADILCDCDPWGPPSRPNFDVNMGIELGAEQRRASYTGLDKEYYFLGINSHQSWDHYVWATASDGWVVTTVPRTKGWHQFEIVVHPYTGGLDVEFWIDGVMIAQGHRGPGPSGTGADVVYLHLGGDPALITQSNLANTFEDAWYDEVALTECHNPRPDVNGDGFVDSEDFGVLQSCITGAADPLERVNALFDAAKCQCFDVNGDQDVDDDDLTVFVDCAAGPAVAANPNCD